MQALLRGIDRAALWGAWGACAAIVAMLGLILAEVLARKLLGISLDFAWEFAGYLLAICLLLGSGHVLRQGLHVRVQLALKAFGPRVGRGVDVMATSMALAITTFLAYALLLLTWRSFLDQTRSFLPSEVLLWPFQAGFALGGVLLALQALARLLRLLQGQTPELAVGDAPVIRAD